MRIPFQTKPDKFIVYGDMGADDSIPTYALLERLINTDEYTAILHVGDLGYDLHSDYGKVDSYNLARFLYPLSKQRLRGTVDPENFREGFIFVKLCICEVS